MLAVTWCSQRSSRALQSAVTTSLVPGALCAAVSVVHALWKYTWCAQRDSYVCRCCRLVAVLERVQGGIIGQTLSRYGVAGLYTVVVLSVGASGG